MAFEHPGPRLRDYLLAVKACFTAFRTGTLDHHGQFYDLDFITPQWSPGPIAAPDPKVDVAAVNPWMLRMAGEVADGLHVHPLGEPGYLSRDVLPNVATGAAKSGRSPSDVAVIEPVMTIVGDSDEERNNERELVRASMSFYGSTPNYAFIWDEAGFEGTTARIREKEKAGDFKGMRRRSTTNTSRPLPSSGHGTAWQTRSSRSTWESQRASSYTTPSPTRALRAIRRHRAMHIDRVSLYGD